MDFFLCQRSYNCTGTFMDKNFKRWQSVSEERQVLDKKTDQRIWANIEHYVQRRQSLKRWYWAAALFIPLTAAVVLTYQPASQQQVPDIVLSATQEKKIFKLRDGSIISLEPGSSLSLKKDFGRNNRMIVFRGKGFFHVAKNTALPFKINAEKFSVEVLGTQFYLDQTSEDKKVHLTEGKVKIAYQNQQIFLSPKQIWKMDKNGDTNILLEPTVEKQFTFQNQQYSKVIEDLERVYLIDISYPEEFGSEIVNGSFTGNLEDILTIISFPFDLDIKMIDNQNIEMKK